MRVGAATLRIHFSFSIFQSSLRLARLSQNAAAFASSPLMAATTLSDMNLHKSSLSIIQSFLSFARPFQNAATVS